MVECVVWSEGVVRIYGTVCGVVRRYNRECGVVRSDLYLFFFPELKSSLLSSLFAVP